MFKFNTDGMVIPQFSFPTPIMDYVLKNLQPQHLIKLFQSSKWFWFKYGQNIIQHLEIVPDGEDESFDFTKTVVCATNPVLKEFVDFWITDSLIDRTRIGFFPLFTHCTIKKLELCAFILWKDYELYTNAGNIEELKIAGVFDQNGFVSVDKIIAQVPNASSIEIGETRFTQTTCASLVSINHKVKMANLILKNVVTAGLHICDLLIEFILRNSDNPCNVYVDYKMVPEVDDFSHDHNALYHVLGIALRQAIARQLEAKELMMKKVAAVL